MASSIKVFCCYARKDKLLLDALKAHLIILQRQGLITLWNDTDISPGSSWEEECELHLKTAHLILLLISSDFIASEYCYSREMKQAIKRHERGETRVIPVILRPVYWQGAPFAKLQALRTGMKPVISSGWHSLDEALLNVVEGIHEAIKSIQAPSPVDYRYLIENISEEVRKGRAISEVLRAYDPNLDALFQAIIDAANYRIFEVMQMGEPTSKAIKNCSPSLENLFKVVISTYAEENNVATLETRIEKLLAEISVVADGDLRVQVEVTEDALGVVADVINFLIEELANAIVHIQVTTAAVTEDTTYLLEIIKAQRYALETIVYTVEEHNASSRPTSENMKYIVEKTKQFDTSIIDGANRIEHIRRIMDALYVSVSSYRLPQLEMGKIRFLMPHINNQFIEKSWGESFDN